LPSGVTFQKIFEAGMRVFNSLFQWLSRKNFCNNSIETSEICRTHLHTILKLRKVYPLSPKVNL